jgi:2'-hydroxyisoflavone reductase
MLDLVEAAASACDADLNVEVVDDAFLTAHGITQELPLWADDPLWAAWADVDVSKAIGAGLRFRPIEDTVAATLAQTKVVPGIGLEHERETALLAAWHAR